MGVSSSKMKGFETIMNNNKYFTLETEAKRQFYQVPKQFMIKESKYYSMTSDSKLLYGILADRNSLSIKYKWVDLENRIYFIATIESLMDLTGWGNQKVTKHLKELRKFELLESVKKGQGNPSWHYLLQIDVEQGLENQLYQQECENHISRNVEFTSQEMLNSHTNNTNINNTEFNNKNYKIREGKPSFPVLSDTTESNIISLEDNDKPKPAIIPDECINDLDKYFIGRLKKERAFYGINFDEGLYYNAFADALLKTQLQDSIEVLTMNQYPYFIKTLKNMIEPLETERKLLGW